IEPDEAHALIAFAKMAGDAGHGANGDRVIPAEHQWDRSAPHGSVDAGGKFFAGRGDLGKELGVAVAGGRGFSLLYVNIAEILDVVPERLQARIEARDAERRRSHVDAAASLAEIEGRSDNRD